MKPLLLFVLPALVAWPALAAEAPKKADVTIQSEILNKATAANLQKAGAEIVLKATDKATKLGIVIETKPGDLVPPLVLVPTDPEWKTVMELAKKLATDRYAKADKTLKDLGVTVTP
jgi:hypothetical protein